MIAHAENMLEFFYQDVQVIGHLIKSVGQLIRLFVGMQAQLDR